MPSFLGGIAFKAIAALAIMAVIGGTVLYIRAIQAENESLTIQRDDAAKAARSNAMAYDLYKTDIGRALSAARREAVKAQARASRAEDLMREVMNAPPGDDGPVAPVLRRAFDGMRGEQLHAPAGNPPGSPAGAGDPAGRTGQAR